MEYTPSAPLRSLDVLVVADPVPSLNPAHDTTVAIIEAAQQEGHRVWVTTASDLSIDEGRPTAMCQSLRVLPCRLDQGRWIAQADWHHLGEAEAKALDEFQVVLMRTDPPIDQTYLRATYVLDLADPSKTVVMNEPAGLRNVNEKLFALHVAHLGPPTLVTASVPAILDRVEAWGRAVLKPTDAMAGRGILILADGDPNLVSILEQATDRGRELVVVQQWIEGVVDGDRRIIVLDGRPLGSVRRVACDTDFRCNMATGAVTVADDVTDDDRRICATLAPLLAKHGIAFAGIDVIGGLLTEINVTSPTGVREIDALSGVRLGSQVVDWMEAAVEIRRAGVYPR